MRRPPKSLRPRELSKREAEAAKKRRLAIGITVAASAVVIAFGVMAVTMKPVDIDKTTGCPLRPDKPLPHTLVMIDGTDRLPVRELDYAEALIRTEYLNLPIGGRLTVASILADPDTPSEIVICRMPDRAKAGDISSNDAKIRKDFQKVAGVRLDRLRAELASGEPQRASPIREMIAVAMDRPDFDSSVPDRRLVILSDFAQHSDAASDYDRTFALSEEAHELLDRDLSEVAVRLHYVRRASLSGLQGARHKQAWTSDLEDLGAEVAVGHGLNIGERGERPIWTRSSQ